MGLVHRIPEGRHQTERLRSSPEDLAALPVTTPQGRILRLDEVAAIRSDLGPGIIRRENVGRLAMLTANVAGSDLAGTVEAARDAVAAAIELPAGYTVTFSGQFEEAIRSERHQDRGGPDPGTDVRPVAGAAGRS